MIDCGLDAACEAVNATTDAGYWVLAILSLFAFGFIAYFVFIILRLMGQARRSQSAQKRKVKE